MKSLNDLVIGVDGGGTKTVASIVRFEDDGTEVELGRGRSGPGNPRAAGFEVAQASIDEAIKAAFADAGLHRFTADSACFCLSGAGRPAEQQQITDWALGRAIARTVRVTGDAEPILAAATDDNFGIALISGTGSLAWGRNGAGEVARNGGWGFLLGDEGSAYAIALAGLRAAVRAVDDRGPPTVMLTEFQRKLDAETPADLIERVYGPQLTRERLASLAIVVFDAASTDFIAQHIVESAAVDLGYMVEVLANHLEIPSGDFVLALSGSVLLNQELLREQLNAWLQKSQSLPRETILVTDPVRGAVALARKNLG